MVLHNVVHNLVHMLCPKTLNITSVTCNTKAICVSDMHHQHHYTARPHLMCPCDGSTESSVASPQLAPQCHTIRWLAGVWPEAEVEGSKQEDPEE